jgi:hypothetical protein
MVAPLAPVAIPAAVKAAFDSVTGGLSAIESIATRFPESATLAHETRVAVKRAKDRLDEARGTLEGMLQKRAEAMSATQRDALRRALDHLDNTANWLHEEVQGLDRQLTEPTCCGCLPCWTKLLTQARNLACVRCQRVQLEGLQRATEALKAATDAVQQCDVVVGHRAPGLYEAPRQLQHVVTALAQGTEVVVVTGGPAMGKSALAREVMRQIHQKEVRPLCPGCHRPEICRWRCAGILTASRVSCKIAQQRSRPFPALLGPRRNSWLMSKLLDQILAHAPHHSHAHVMQHIAEVR